MSVESTLANFGGNPAVPQGFVHPVWPVITPEYEKVIIDQMRTSMSIYNRSGIIEEFEDKFASIHESKYALLANSGTNAIWSMLVGADLRPGDEVLCPTYTFYATNTPLLWSGLVPVFCDADDSGGINIADMKKRVTKNTKAIIVTHMWGYPCDMEAISKFAKDTGLLLFEDCSHAHLAKIDGKYVGTYGDASAWSLQGQKNITGGEGGIIVTNNREIYIRAMLQGHYNKRCKQEMPESHELYKFALTGMGLKMRSHPLAVAFANLQLEHYESYQAMRNECAVTYDQLFAKYDFISPLLHEGTEPSWYAYVIRFDEIKAGISRQEFVKLLHAEGMLEVDIPGSTGPNHELPIFREPNTLFPHFYGKDEKFNTNDIFPGASSFYESIIKFPTWTQSDAHREILGYYIDGLKKVCDYVGTNR